MIKKMIFSLLHINELLAYSNEIKTYLQASGLESLPIQPLVVEFVAKQEKALAASNRSQSSQYTQWLRETDHRRDESFIAFRNLMEANTHRADEDIVRDAAAICRIIRGHGWSLYAEGQKVESAKLASLIKELELEENQTAITSLNSLLWYKEMVDDNSAYTQMVEDKAKTKAGEVDYDTEKLYKDLRLTCNDLFDSIEVLNRINPDPKYLEIANYCNECTQKYIAAGRSRKTKKENADSETADTEAK